MALLLDSAQPISQSEEDRNSGRTVEPEAVALEIEAKISLEEDDDDQEQIIDDLAFIAQNIEALLHAREYSGNTEDADRMFKAVNQQIKNLAISLGSYKDAYDLERETLKKSGMKTVLVPANFTGSWYIG